MFIICAEEFLLDTNVGQHIFQTKQTEMKNVK